MKKPNSNLMQLEYYDDYEVTEADVMTYLYTLGDTGEIVSVTLEEEYDRVCGIIAYVILKN